MGTEGDEAEGSVPRPSAYHREPKNLCRRCGYDFAYLSGFDAHRERYRLNYRQNLVGDCIPPEEMGLVEYNGRWYTPESRFKILTQVATLARHRQEIREEEDQ